MRRAALLGLAAISGALSAGSASAAQVESDGQLKAQIETALRNIEHARCGTDFCAAATPEELAAPPITLSETDAVLQRGILSGLAKACDLDWRALSYQTMADTLRAQGKTDRQMALVGILHGMSFGQTLAAVGAKPCTPKLRSDIQAQLSTFP